jgi:6-phosphogluconolactonase
MKKVLLSIIFTLAIVVGLCAAFATGVSAKASPAPDAVYAMTNEAGGNAVVMFSRADNGTLTKIGTFSTMGMGMGSAIDPLGSEGSLVLTPDGKWLLAVNAGSDDITVFKVEMNGLDFVEKVGSGGTMPVSLTIFGNSVFALNAGGNPNITGFHLSASGNLNQVAGFTRDLGAGGYAEVGFNPWGNWLVVTDKAGSRILVFSVNPGGKPSSAPVSTMSNGLTPFGFFFDKWGNLLAVEVNGGTNGSVSSYAIMPNGALSVISGSVHNSQGAACWIAGNASGSVFTTNPGSASISSYTDSSGTVTLLMGAESSGIHDIDEGMSNDGNFLYGLDPVSGNIDMFPIMANGHLGSLVTTAGGFAIYAQGIAVW